MLGAGGAVGMDAGGRGEQPPDGLLTGDHGATVPGPDGGVGQQRGHPVEIAGVDELGVPGDEVGQLGAAGRHLGHPTTAHSEAQVGVVPVGVDGGEQTILVGGEHLDPVDRHGRSTGHHGNLEVDGHVGGAGVDSLGRKRPGLAGGDGILEEGGDRLAPDVGWVGRRIGLDAVLGEEIGDGRGIPSVDGIDVGDDPLPQLVWVQHRLSLLRPGAASRSVGSDM